MPYLDGTTQERCFGIDPKSPADQWDLLDRFQRTPMQGPMRTVDAQVFADFVVSATAMDREARLRYEPVDGYLALHTILGNEVLVPALSMARQEIAENMGMN